MSDPFASSRLKLAWAKKHLADFERETKAWFDEQDYASIFIEPHPNKPDHVVHKLRFTKQIPDVWSEVVGTIVDSLRAALDHAIYGVAVAAGCNNPRNAYFPFSKDAASFEANLKGRCADVPKEIFALLRSFHPYKGGDEVLFALNEVCVANKHKILIPVGAGSFSAGVNTHGTGFVTMPCTPVWDSAKNEMELFTLGPQTAQFHGDFQFGCYVAFGKVSCLEGKVAGSVLEKFVTVVEAILGEIEGKTRRLGFIK
jgi:hypothetical protein